MVKTKNDTIGRGTYTIIKNKLDIVGTLNSSSDSYAVKQYHDFLDEYKREKGDVFYLVKTLAITMIPVKPLVELNNTLDVDAHDLGSTRPGSFDTYVKVR